MCRHRSQPDDGGRLSGIHASTTKSADGKLTIRAEVGLIDPAQAIRSVTLHYIAIGANQKKPNLAEALEKQAGAQKLVLKIEGGIASGELSVEAPDRELFLQAAPEAASGKLIATSIRNISLTPGVAATKQEPGDPAKPPAGWKAASPRDSAPSPSGCRRNR